MLHRCLCQGLAVQFNPGMGVECASFLAHAYLQYRIQPVSAQQGPHQQRLRQAARLKEAASSSDRRQLGKPLRLLYVGSSRRAHCLGPNCL